MDIDVFGEGIVSPGVEKLARSERAIARVFERSGELDRFGI